MLYRAFKVIDRTFVLAVFCVLVFGLVILASASHAVTSNTFLYVEKQVAWILIGIGLVFVILNFDTSHLSRQSRILYALTIGLLLLVLAVGSVKRGSQSWLTLGGINLQVAEFAKILLILAFADFLNKRLGQLETLAQMIPCFIYMGIPFLLVVAQGDLGTGLTFLVITLGMMFVAGANPRILTALTVGGLLLAVLALVAHIKFGVPLPLEDYQIKRFTSFIDPYNDGMGGRGAGWNTIQALVAVGSGGFWGKGLFHGTQAQLNFLPEQHTDFIFAVVGEEMGFIGAALLIMLLGTILWRAINIAYNAKDFYSTLVAMGLVSMWTFHIFENIGMCIGVMPITGIPLPFVSYGGSFMLASMLGVGILLDINLRGKKIVF